VRRKLSRIARAPCVRNVDFICFRVKLFRMLVQVICFRN
jgi:hypothetical protein